MNPLFRGIDSRVFKHESDMSHVKEALEKYYNEHGHVSVEALLAALNERSVTLDAVHGWNDLSEFRFEYEIFDMTWVMYIPNIDY